VLILRQSEDLPVAATVVRVEPTAAFSVLLTHAHCFDQGNRSSVAAMVTNYLSIAACVPTFRLTYRPDFSSIDQLISAVFEGVGFPHQAMIASDVRLDVSMSRRQ
jgi:hypothetical protein